MTLPDCPTHGPMQKVPAGTPEQAWCGEWWRCELCTHSVLRPSENIMSAYDIRRCPHCGHPFPHHYAGCRITRIRAMEKNQ